MLIGRLLYCTVVKYSYTGMMVDEHPSREILTNLTTTKPTYQTHKLA